MKKESLDKDKKKRRTIVWIVIVIAAAVAVLVIALCVHASRGNRKGQGNVAALADTSADVTLANTYSIDLGIYDDEEVFTITFEKADEIFRIYTSDSEWYRGLYDWTGNLLELTYYTSTGEIAGGTELIIEGDYLLMGESVYSGEIPDGDTFEAEATHTDSSSGTTITYSFREDGTYTCTELTSDGDEYVMEGEYTRNGGLIERTLSGYEMLPFYVYKNCLFTSFYTVVENVD